MGCHQKWRGSETDHAERGDHDVVQEAVIESETMTVGGVVPCERHSMGQRCTQSARREVWPLTSHRHGEDGIGLVGAAVGEGLGNTEVLVGGRDVPGDDAALVEEVGLSGGRGRRSGSLLKGEKARRDAPEGGT